MDGFGLRIAVEDVSIKFKKMKLIIKILYYFLIVALLNGFMNECYEIQAYLLPIIVPLSIFIIEFITKKYEAKSFYISFSIIWLPVILKEIFYEPGLIYSLLFINEPIFLLSYPLYLYSLRQFNAKKLGIVIGIILIMFYVNFRYREDINDYQNFGNITEIQHVTCDTLSVLDQNAQKIKLFLNTNNKILIKFWSYSCPVCIAEAPILDSFYNTDKHMEIKSIYIVSKDSTKEFNAFIKQKSKVKSYFLIDTSLPKSLNIYAYPTYVVLLKGKPIFKGTIKKAMQVMKE